MSLFQEKKAKEIESSRFLSQFTEFLIRRPTQMAEWRQIYPAYEYFFYHLTFEQLSCVLYRTRWLGHSKAVNSLELDLNTMTNQEVDQTLQLNQM